MENQHAFDSIDASAFDDVLKNYASVVPENLADLENQRLDVIPRALEERNPAFLTKFELATLMDWKL